MAQGFAPFTPFGVSTSRAASPFNYGSPTHLPSGGGSGFTLAQAIAMLAAKKDHPSRSFLGDLTHGAKFGLNKVAWTLDKLERPAYAVANAVDKGASYHHIDVGAALHGAREGFMGREKTNFGDVLKHNDLLSNHKILRGIAGLTADVALDPLSYTGVGAVRKIGAEGLRAASDAVLHGSYSSVNTGAQAAENAAKFAEHAKVLKAGGDTFAHRAVHAQKLSDVYKTLAEGKNATEATRTEINISRETAAAEAKLHDAKKLALRFGTMRHNVQIPIAPLPKSSQKIGNQSIKFLSPAAKKLGEAFKPGYNNEILHAQLLARRHQGERMAGEYFAKISANFSSLGKLSEKKQREALHFFEKPGKVKAVIKKGDGYILNPHHLARARKAGLSEDQIAFVQAMHDTGEFFAKKHAEYGTKFEHLGAQGKLYVPHILTKSGEGVTDHMIKTNMLTKKGFQHKRLIDMSIKELHDVHADGGFTHKVETNPFTLLAMHARSVANQHADQNLVNYMSYALGVPAKLVNHNALVLNKTAHAAIQSSLAKHGVFDEQGHLNKMQELTDHHEALSTQRFKDFQAASQAAIRHHLEVEPWKQTTKATVARISQRAVDAQGAHAAEIAAIRAQKFKPLLKDQRPFKELRSLHARQLKGFESKAASLMKEQAKLAKGTVPNPEYDATTMRKVDQLTNEHGQKLHFPTEIADAMERLKKVMVEDDDTLKAFSENYRKWLGQWKLAVTSVNPSYASRNTLSDFWNAYLSGVPIHAMPIYGGKAAKMIRDAKLGSEAIAKGGELTAKQHHAVSVMLDAYDAGILSGLYAGDVNQVANMMEHANSKLSLLQRGHVVKALAKVSMDVNRNRENWGRLTHYLYRIDNGDGAVKAAEKVKEAHFDYEDLTPFEQKKLKLVAPFYTWSRKNMPFQIKKLAEAPGQYAAFPQALSEADPSGSPGILPSYMNNGMYAKFGSKFYNPMIGVSDLENAVNPAGLVKGLLSPFIKVPVELMTNKNMLTGLPIKDPVGYDRNPSRGGVSDLLKLIPGANVGETGRRDKNGKMIHGVGIDPRLSYLLGQTPGTNLLFNQGSKIRGEQTPENAHRATVAWLTGINGTSVDQQQQAKFALINFQKVILPGLMKNYRAHGQIPAAAIKKLSPNEQLIANALFKSLGG